MRMRMTNTDNGMTAIQVKILFTFIIPYIGAFCFCNGDVIDRIYIKKIHYTKFKII